MNLNASLDAFEPNVRGTRRLVDLASTSFNLNHIRFLFVSSSSVGQAWPRTAGPFPEEVSDLQWSVGLGYGESKCVAEHVRPVFYSLVSGS
jgi:nucleoside-diphosphate-sugar epimerase